jgi:hypothetical protein
MKLELTKISMVGFKGYKDNVEYLLGYRTLIQGDNGLGKSTVGDAVAWALTGCNICGNERATTDLVNNNKPKLTEVVLDFLLDDEPQTIIRRKKGSSNDLYWNDQKVTTNDISRDIFRNKDLFLSILNPYYFKDLTPKDAKQLLSDILKPVSRTDIFKELGEYLEKVLLDNGFRMPETFLSDARSDLKDQEENIIFLEGKASNLNQVEIQEKKIFDDTELKSLKNEVEELNRSNGVEVELAKLEKPKNISAELSELRVQEVTIKATLNNISLKELLPVEAKNEKKDQLLKDYKSKKNKLDIMESKIIKCDSCGTEIDLTKEAKEMLKQEVDEMLEQGLQLKAEIEGIEIKNNKIIDNNKKIKGAKEAEINKKLAAINQKRQKLLAGDEVAQKKYEEKKQLIIAKNATREEEVKEKINYIKTKISSLEEDQKEVIKFNAQIDSAIENNSKLVEDQKQNEENAKNSKNKIEQLKLAIDAAKQYNSIKLKKQSEQIKPYLDKVEIQFEKLTKDGELKEDFKILYDGKTFNQISKSQKIKASLEIANLFMNVTNLHFPICLDDAESINVIPELDTQMIKARVTLDKEIKVEVIEQ